MNRRDYEQQLLKILATRRKTFIKYRSLLEPRMFSNVSRRLFFMTLVAFYKDNATKLGKKKTLISKELMLTEASRRFGMSEIKRRKKGAKNKWRRFTIETDLIFGIMDLETVAVLLSKLNDEIKREQILSVSLEASEAADEGKLDEALKMLRGVVLTKSNNDNNSVLKVRGDVDWLDKNMEERRKHPESFGSIKTGTKLDVHLLGLQRNHLVSVFGPTGRGKSTYAKSLVVGALKNNKARGGRPLNVLHISTEESRDEVMIKYYAAVGETPQARFIKGDMNRSDLQEINKKMKKAFNGEIFIKRLPSGSSIDDVRQVYEELVEEHGIKFDILVLDWMELMCPSSFRNSKDYQDETEVYKEALGLVSDHAMAGLVVSQAKDEAKKIRELYEVSLSLISGAKNKSDFCYGVIFLKTLKEDKKGRYGSGRTTVMLLKNRTSGILCYHKINIYGSTGHIKEDSKGPRTYNGW